jgi:two-component system, NtrC family, nitrogen regulation response regulator NtrX
MKSADESPVILIVDDVESIRRSLRNILESEGYIIKEAVNGKDCLDKAATESPDLIILDISMPIMDGIKALGYLQLKHPEIPVIMLSGEGDIDTAVELLHQGAFHFLRKPPDLMKLLSVIKRALGREQKMAEMAESTMKHAPKPPQNGKDSVIGTSLMMKEFQHQLNRMSVRDDIKVLLTGENGTGKGHAAKWIHTHSKRNKKPFVTVNCGALTETLLESELFGHKKGSFSDAKEDRMGKFVAAEGGTIFLDEIGNMSMEAQKRLLNVLNDDEIYKVGEDKPIKINVRVIAATNKNLEEEVKEGRFFIDLYHRLKVADIVVPPLRERKEDIEGFIGVFNDEIARKTGLPKLNFEPKALELLRGRHWEGNIRELDNAIKKLHAFCDGLVTATDVVKYLK